VRTTIAPPTGDPALHPQRHRWRVVLALVIGLMGSAAYAGWFLTNYDPICHSNCTGGSVAFGPGMRSVGSVISPESDDVSLSRIDHQPGRTFIVGFPLESSGPIGVTIEQIGLPHAPGSALRFRTVEFASEQGNPVRDRRPFHPLALPPNDIFDVFVTYEMRGCMEAGTGTTLSAIPIEFRVLGATRHTTIDLPVEVDVSGHQVSCPG
jgi:hypothetical protein